MHSYTGKTVIVTGAGSGIGYTVAKRFAEAGAWVALNDYNADLAQKAVQTLNSELDRESVHAFAGDVADAGFIQQMVDQVVERSGRLDVMIANAGITDYGPFLDYNPAAFDRLTGVNLRGTYFSAQAAAKAMIAANIPGRIILTASVTGIQAHKNLSAYGMTKAGIIHLAHYLAVELGAYGITVNTVSPGATTTERTMQQEPDFGEKWAKVAPTGRAATTDDIAAAMMFLASDEARQITGTNLTVDGGWTIYSPLPPETP